MLRSFFCNKYMILVLAFFSPMIINIGGEVSPSFLFIAASSPLWVNYISFKAGTPFRYILNLLLALVAVQVIWALFADTPAIDQIKGILIVISGTLYFMYYYMVYTHRRDVVKWAVLGTFLASFVFTNVMAEREGSDFGLWKFQIAPRLVSCIMLLYLWLNDKKFIQKVAPLLFIAIGTLCMATGARSTGLIPFFAGTIAFILQMKNRVNLSSIKKYLLIGSCSLYAAYACLYVPNVLNGNISGGNSEQLSSMENPYNPLGLLMIGRSDAIVPFIAFLDKPLTGWGYWTPDPKGKYYLMKMDMHGDEDVVATDISKSSPIPGHSGWGYLSCSYGILGFMICFLIVRKTTLCLFESLIIHDKYLLYRIYVILGFLWGFLFSPLPHFKTSTSSIAIVIVFSLFASKGKVERFKDSLTPDKLIQK